MTDNIELLHCDHRSFARTLRLLGRSIDEMAAGGDPDYGLMYDVMYYMTHYPDLVHHAREDLIFRRLLAYAPALRDAVEEQLDEHRQIVLKGGALLDVLAQVLAGEMIARRALEAAARDYLDLQLAHMRREEKQLLPLAAERLSAEDWAQIDEQLAHKPDPLYGQTIRKQYQNLVARIAALQA